MNRTALKSIGARIKELCPSIKHIDIYNAQYTPDMEGNTKLFAKPAAFIEFTPTQWDGDENEGVQEGNGGIVVHVVMQKLTDTFKIFDKSDDEQDAMLAHFDAAAEVQKALHGWQADGTLSAMTRVMSTPDHDYDGYIVEMYEYVFRDIAYEADRTTNYQEHTITTITPSATVVTEPAGD
jgi:hypothetical protein